MRRKTRRKKSYWVRWDVTARRWCKKSNLPNGCLLALERAGDKRRVRGDLVIHRYHLPDAADDKETLADALRQLSEVLITDIAARKYTLRLYSPAGDGIGGNMQMGKIRKLPGIPTEEDEMAAEFEAIETDMLVATMRSELDRADDVSSSSEISLRAYVRALLERFSAKEISLMLEEERKNR